MNKLYIFLILLHILSFSHAQWTQIGSDVNGESAGDESGQSVSINSNGSIVAFGAPLNDGNDTIDSQRGNVRVYEYSAGDWIQKGNDIVGDSYEDYLGCSVSLNSDGDILAIGALGNDGNDTNDSQRGHVKVFEYLNGNWDQLGVDIIGEDSLDWFGKSVKLSHDGSIIAVGAYKNDGNGTDAGHVRIYKYISGNWSQLGNDIDGESAGDFSGYSLDLNSDGSIVAIGAIRNDGNDTTDSNRGHVRVFEYFGGNWIQLGNDIIGEDYNNWFGYSVGLDSTGTKIIIGAPYNDGNGYQTHIGHVRVFHYIGNNWIQIGNDIEGDALVDWFGYSVSINSSGSVIAIGANRNDGNGVDAGRVKIFHNYNGNWVQKDNNIDGEAAYDISGFSVDLNSDGSIVAIGAPCNNDNGIWAGHVRVLKNCSSIIIDTSVTQHYDTLIANSNNTFYQWLNCDSSYTPIYGETDQSFTTTNPGNYAVIVIQNSCSDTSSCYSITSVKNIENHSNISIFPNPTTGKISVQAEKIEKIEVLGIKGQIVYSDKKNNIDLSQESKGIYIIKVITSKQIETRKIIKQ